MKTTQKIRICNYCHFFPWFQTESTWNVSNRLDHT